MRKGNDSLFGQSSKKALVCVCVCVLMCSGEVERTYSVGILGGLGTQVRIIDASINLDSRDIDLGGCGNDVCLIHTTKTN